MYDNHTEKIYPSQIEEGVTLSYKERGETLSVFLDRFRKEESLSKEIPLTYAGRLDPMAEGEMIVLSGESCKKKELFLGRDKTYLIEVLFGVGTDTGDMLGLIVKKAPVGVAGASFVDEALDMVSEMKEFPYPAFSSKPHNGVPLFTHARNRTLPQELPIKKGEIKRAGLLSTKEVPLSTLISRAIPLIQKVHGDFRQNEIVSQWETYEHDETRCTLATLELTVTSGVYMRTIAELLGKKVGLPALAYSIKRISFK